MVPGCRRSSRRSTHSSASLWQGRPLTGDAVCRQAHADAQARWWPRSHAVGDMVYRLVTKTIIRHSSRRDFLLPYLFGVGSKGGVEPVVRSVERTLDSTVDRPYTYTSIDFSKAFNTVDRRDITEGLRQYTPVLYRAGRWHKAVLPSSCSARPRGDTPSPRHSVSDRATRWDRSCSRSGHAHCSDN